MGCPAGTGDDHLEAGGASPRGEVEQAFGGAVGADHPGLPGHAQPVCRRNGDGGIGVVTQALNRVSRELRRQRRTG